MIGGMSVFTEPSTLPFQLPPFAEIGVEDFEPAFDTGMQMHLAAVRWIADRTDEPTFDNTVLHLERVGTMLSRVSSTFFNLTGSMSTEALRAVEARVVPALTAHNDRIRLDPALFARIDAVHRAEAASPTLTGEDAQLLGRYHLDFVLAGAGLDDDGRRALAELNGRLSTLTTTFGQNLLKATEAAAVVIDDVADLDGLSDDAIGAAAAAATDRGLVGKYLITLVLPTGQPLLKVLRNRDVRRRLFEASVHRAEGGEHDNRPVLLEIVGLRAQRARLLGFGTHADATVADQTVGSLAAMDEFLGRVVGPAVANARVEAQQLAEAAAADGVTELEPWDWAYYSDRIYRDRYEVDTAALRPYFKLDRVLTDGVFAAARGLFGIEMVPRADLTGYHPDVRIWEVRDASGEPIGLFLGDYFARDGKRGGAWMSSFVDQNHLHGTRPVIVNVLNIPRPAAGEPALVTLDELRTLFHEFGHALHGLFSDVRYPRFSGTSVPRDFVEYPSQVNEMWVFWPELLADYARHVHTGEPLPAEVVGRIQAAQLWGEGFGTVEYLAATLLDQAWHRIAPDEVPADVVAFETAALAAAGIDLPLVPPRYRSTYFQHIFDGGYSAGYYSYIWSEVLDADTVDMITDNGGLTRANGDHLRATLLSVGGSVDALDAFRNLRGRDADIEPLLRRRGLLPAE
ncbi:M3 family metallopeptidase [Nakamurella sp.]|uniref:M3 family metallopeptidase n=1 Tax=Nakamurella sp. TaxID=1869182 RepID=UPI003782E339